MKARIPFLTSAQRKQARVELQAEYQKVAAKERDDLTRRIIKTVIFVMHEVFGFGKVRITKLFKRFTEVLEHSDKDAIFWEHIDRVVIDELGFPFERDFTEDGHVISESDYWEKVKAKKNR